MCGLSLVPKPASGMMIFIGVYPPLGCLIVAGQYRMLLVKVRCLLIGVCDAQDACLVKGLAQYLQADWQAVDESTGRGEGANAGQVH